MVKQKMHKQQKQKQAVLMSHSNNKGFTLVELLIVIAIIGLLLAIGIPSYNQSVLKSNRAEGAAALMSFANAMERVLTNQGSYTCADGDCEDGDIDTTLTSPASNIFASTAPLDAGAGAATYNLRIYDATDTSFELRAIPVGRQLEDSACGYLSITSSGRKDSEYGTVNQCW